MTDRSPFCPPAEPRARRRRVPSGRSMSSTTTQSSEGSTPFFWQRARTASPEAFMYVCGRARSTGVSPTLPRPTREEHSRDRIRIPSSAASASTTRKPALCRVVFVLGPPDSRGRRSRAEATSPFPSPSSRASRSSPQRPLPSRPCPSSGPRARWARRPPRRRRPAPPRGVGCATWTTTFSGSSTIVTPSSAGSSEMRMASPIAELRDVDRDVRRDVGREALDLDLAGHEVEDARVGLDAARRRRRPRSGTLTRDLHVHQDADEVDVQGLARDAGPAASP